MSDSLVSSLSTAVDASPDDFALRLRLAQLLLDNGRPGEALTHIGVAILLRPESPSTSALLVGHPDFPKYVALAGNKAMRGGANVAARTILGLRADEPIKTGPRGKQKYAQHGRSIETVARFLQRYAADAAPKPIRLTVTLSGSDVAGGTVVVPSDHRLYAELVAALFGSQSNTESKRPDMRVLTPLIHLTNERGDACCDLTEPEKGSVVLTEGDHGTAWQRHFKDGLWHSALGGAPKTWAWLTAKRNLRLAYDANAREGTGGLDGPSTA